MKTSKEKANELCMYFQELLFVNLTDENFIHFDSKKCAIRCVKEILNSCPIYPSYWENVKKEIELL